MFLLFLVLVVICYFITLAYADEIKPGMTTWQILGISIFSSILLMGLGYILFGGSYELNRF